MRVTDGSVAASVQRLRLRLPLGVGLGELVAQTATPYSTRTTRPTRSSRTPRRSTPRWPRRELQLALKLHRASGGPGNVVPPG